MDSNFSWLFHRIINLSVEDIDQNLSQQMQGLPKMSQIGGLFFEHDQVNHDLSVLCQWLRANKISLKYQQNRNHNFLTKEEANITKHLNFRINGQKINNCSNVKYLGIMLEENLEWNLHLNLLKSKAK